MNMQQLIIQAINNSAKMPLGTYKFTDFLTLGQFPPNYTKVDKQNTENEFYNAVKLNSVPNVKFHSKSKGITSYYEKYF